MSQPENNSPKYEPLFHVVLHQPEIPPNTGTVGRTCVAVGAKLWLVRPLGFQIDEKSLRRAGLDYWQHLEWEVVDNWEALTQRLDVSRMWMLTKRAEISFLKVDFQKGDVFVFGCETAGLPDSILNQRPERNLRIPTRPQVRSLNLSCSVGVIAYQAVRQLGLPDVSLD